MSNFIYHNVNPRGRTLPDCVTRAISLACNIPYYEVRDMLAENGEYYSCDRLCVGCYSYLLEDTLGYKAYEGNGQTVNEIIEQYPESILLLRIEGHLTCSIDKIVFDIWDCTMEICDKFWIIDR